MKTLVVTGGRHYKNEAHVIRTLSKLGPARIAVGCCPSGVDFFVRTNFAPFYTVYFADWTGKGLPAGPIRNSEMLAANPNAIVVAFPGGKGTRDCVRQALERGMLVIKVEEPT